MATNIFKSENKEKKDIAALISAGIIDLGRGTSQERQIQIIEGAIKSYVVDGIHKVNFGTVAAACGVTRPLVQHYFATPDTLFEAAVKYVRFLFRNAVLDKVQRAKDPKEELRLYIQSCFDWIEEQPTHAKFWVLFLFRCGSSRAYRTQNTELVKLGQQTIESILERGKKSGHFSTTKPPVAAKRIQRILTGYLISAGTEEGEVSAYYKDAWELCSTLASR